MQIYPGRQKDPRESSTPDRYMDCLSHELLHRTCPENAKKEDMQTLPKIVPPRLHKYLDIFDKERAKQFPESQPWDHAIELKEDFLPSDCKVYRLILPETEEMNKFIDKNLAKGYIRPSKSPMASPFFFVDKKDSMENTGL